ncbi:MAG: SpoIIE family protein phosphatase, partial [Verrucomicrobia bacterium]|nr:SpoIIE family protein phosphatase [Verrucomicrobiota bacterium]
QTDVAHYAGIGLETATPAWAILTIPLEDGEACHGVMQALNPIGRDHFDDFDEEVFQAFGSLIATTLTRMAVQETAKQREIEDNYRDAELSIARRAQSSFLPPPEYSFGDLSIRVFQEQAAYVGGDFYSYHVVSDGGLLVAVGDASGKGIPAALESVRACTLISLTAKSCSAEQFPHWLAQINRVLHLAAEVSGTLTTLTVLLVDRAKRKLCACSFGQSRPFMLIPGQGWKLLDCMLYPALGVTLRDCFAVTEVPLGLAERWLLMTDGFAEARNADDLQFGEQAVLNSLANSFQHGADPLITLEESWRQFREGGPDPDDSTALLLADTSTPPAASFSFIVQPETVPEARVLAEQWASWIGFPDPEIYRIVLAVDEILTNIYRHAYCGQGGKVEIQAKVSAACLTFTFQHWGIGLKTIPARTVNQVGGYGIPFVQSVFDEVDFLTKGSDSIVRLSKCIKYKSASLSGCSFEKAV